jgi:glycosyltransferase involved in cell wall biosynthesis
MRISIALTSFNQVTYTDSALESLVKSTSNTERCIFDLMLLDDCSTEDINPLIDKYKKSVAFNINSENKGLTNLWNMAYRLSSGCNYLILSNNDVIFPKGWAEILIREMIKVDADVAAPITNAPGDVRAQQVRSYLAEDKLVISDAQADVDANCSALQSLSPDPVKLPRLNGFCLAFKYEYLTENLLPNGKPFDENHKIFGAEIEFFKRCKPRAFAIPSCYVFHYKGVSVNRIKFNRQRYRRE